jgi:hypothetical protein
MRHTWTKMTLVFTGLTLLFCGLAAYVLLDGALTAGVRTAGGAALLATATLAAAFAGACWRARGRSPAPRARVLYPLPEELRPAA